MNKMIVLFIGVTLLTSCLTNNKSSELELKDFYFPYKDLFEPQIYCYANVNDTTDKTYWSMQTKIEGKDTIFLTSIKDAQLRLTEELEEKIVENGSRLQKYTLYKNESNNTQISAPCQVIDSVIFNWNQNVNESMILKVHFPDFTSKQTIEFTKKRTWMKFDSQYKTAIFTDINSMKMESSFLSHNYVIENYYKKGVGLINYKIFEESKLLKDYKLISE